MSSQDGHNSFLLAQLHRLREVAREKYDKYPEMNWDLHAQRDWWIGEPEGEPLREYVANTFNPGCLPGEPSDDFLSLAFTLVRVLRRAGMKFENPWSAGLTEASPENYWFQFLFQYVGYFDETDVTGSGPPGETIFLVGNPFLLTELALIEIRGRVSSGEPLAGMFHSLVGDKPLTRGSAWFDGPPPESDGWHGPIEGSFGELSTWIGRGSRPTLKRHNGKMFWIQKLPANEFRCWFKQESDFARAKQAQASETSST